MKTIRAATLVALFVGGCAVQPETEALSSAREYREANFRIKVMERFEARKRRCERRGGVMQVTRQSSGRFPPSLSELQTATCESRRSLRLPF